MKPIEAARARLNAAKAEDPGWEKFELVLKTGLKMKATMVERGLTAASDKCPKCQKSGALHGRLVVGQAAGRHRRSGGAFRMWCDNCDVRMME